MEDGGYYALKGFDFQIDKTIIELFSTPSDTEEISVERIQDLSSEAFVTQVKYKETQKFSFSQIRDPVMQLITESASDHTNRTYILYCYFADQLEDVQTFDVAGLDRLLEIKMPKNCSKTHKNKHDAIQGISAALKSTFAARFKLVFAPKHAVQFDQALDLISKQDFCHSTAEAVFYYCYIADYLRRLVISNVAPENRKCTRISLVVNINDKKRQFFYSSLDRFKGRQALIKFLKEKFVSPIPSQNVVICIGESASSKIPSILDLIFRIVEQHFHNATYDVFPITFSVSKASALALKKGLIDRNITFNDGFEEIEFSSAQFNRKHIALRKVNATNRPLEGLGQISYKIRIAAHVNYRASRAGEPLPDRAYYFDVNELSGYSNVPSFQINGLDCDEIWQLFKR